MAGATYWARAAIRRRWRSALLVGAMIAVTAAVVLTALAGAVRTSTSWDRFLDATKSFDYGVVLADEEALTTANEVLDAPYVTGHGTMQWVPVVPKSLEGSYAGSFALGGGAGSDVLEPLIVEGRAARAHRADEFTANEIMARTAGLRVGEAVELVVLAEDDRPGYTVVSTLVGVHRSALDVGVNAGFANALLPPAFLAEHGQHVPVEAPFVIVRLRDEAASAKLEAALKRAFPTDTQPLVLSSAITSAAVDDVISVQAFALTGVAAVAAMAGLAVSGQAVAREARTRSGDGRMLRTLGFSRRRQAVALVLPDVVVVLVAIALAVTLAVLASTLLPFGLAGDVEPQPGTRFDPLVHVGGAVLLGIILLTASLRVAVSDSGPSTTTVRPQSRWLASRPAVSSGVRWAVSGRAGRASAPVRSGSASVAAAIAGAVVVVTLLASVDHLRSTPALHGWDFDIAVNAGQGAEDPAAVLNGVATGTGTGAAAIADIRLVQLTVDGRGIEAFAVVNRRGAIEMTMVDGRAPTGLDEVALGRDLAGELGVGIGDVIQLEGSTDSVTAAVVGIGAYPELGGVGMSHGASLSGQLADLVGATTTQNLLFIRLADGPAGAALGEQLSADGDIGFEAAFVPPTVSNLDEIGQLPGIAGVTLVVLGLGGFAHAMTSSIRRRRNELAALRALGMTRRQSRAVVLVCGTIVMTVGTVIGIVMGVVTGRWLWDFLADRLGVAPVAVVPSANVAAIATMAVVSLIVVAMPIARRASRGPVAPTLRVE